MRIFEILLRGKRYIIKTQGPEKRKSPARSSRRAGGTPIRSVRRKFLLLGQPYSVRLYPDAARNGLKIDPQDRTFHLSLALSTRENFDEFMASWYKRQARKVFQQAVDYWMPLLREAGYDFPSPRIKIFDMRRAWGRCYYTKELLTMNLHLVKAPQVCIDYIVLHELCHFVIHNHSAPFHRLVSQFMPDWQQADDLLKEFARKHRIIR